MKRLIITFTIACLSIYGFSQSNMLSVSGGWAFANVDDSDYFTDDPNIKGSGWRINGTYDFNNDGGPIAYGISIGYASVEADYTDGADTTTNYKIGTLPFYFAPKYIFGSDKVKGFAKLAIGGQSSDLKRTSSKGEVTGTDFGFYGGGGAGLMVFVHEMVFINAEYEIAYMTNNYYRNGLIQSALLGVGVKF